MHGVKQQSAGMHYFLCTNMTCDFIAKLRISYSIALLKFLRIYWYFASTIPSTLLIWIWVKTPKCIFSFYPHTNSISFTHIRLEFSMFNIFSISKFKPRMVSVCECNVLPSATIRDYCEMLSAISGGCWALCHDVDEICCQCENRERTFHCRKRAERGDVTSNSILLILRRLNIDNSERCQINAHISNFQLRF